MKFLDGRPNPGKRTEGERIRDEIMVVKFWAQGLTYNEIIEKLHEENDKYILSIYQVRKILKNLENNWREASFETIDFEKKKAITKLDVLEREYWEAWRRSLQPQKHKKIQRSLGEERTIVNEDNNLENQRELIIEKVIEGETESVGDPRFLEGVERCIEKKAKLLGLYNPIKFFGDSIEEGNELYELPLEEVHKRLVNIIQVNNVTITNENK